MTGTGESGGVNSVATSMTKRMALDDPRRKIRRRLEGRVLDGSRKQLLERNQRIPENVSRAALLAADAARKERFKKLYPQNKWRLVATCKLLHTTSQRVYQWLTDDPEFAAWWQDEQVSKVEGLEEEFDRVVENEAGMPAIVGRIFRLKGEAPHKYRERGPYQSGGEGRMQVELVFKPRVIEGEFRRLPSPTEEDQGTE